MNFNQRIVRNSKEQEQPRRLPTRDVLPLTDKFLHNAHVSSNGHQVADVWIVEEDSAFRHVLMNLIHTDASLLCAQATDRVEQVITALRRGLQPRLLLLQLRSPELGDLHALRQIRQIAPEVGILVLTNESMDEQMFEVLCAGASGYLLRSSSPAQLRDGIQATLNGGSPISPMIARKLLNAFQTMHSPKPDYRLTTRERQTLQLLVEAKTLQQIASHFNVSRHTVDSHVRRIYAKLHVNTRAGAVAKATKERLL